MAGLFRKILVPIDFGPNSLAALQLARDLAKHEGSILFLLHVISAPIAPEGISLEPFPAAQAAVKGRLEEIAARHVGDVEHELVIRTGDPAACIVEAQRDLGADLIVMATHGRSGLGRLIIGSVAGRVVRESSSPVMTVRGGGRRG